MSAQVTPVERKEMPSTEGTLCLDVSCFGPWLKISAESAQSRDVRSMRSVVQHEVDHDVLSRLSDEIAALLHRANTEGAAGELTLQQVKRAGHRLYDELFPQPIKTVLRENSATTLCLTIDEQLVTLPWELLYDGAQFWGMRFAMGRIVRTEQAILGEPRDVAQRPLSMLVVCDPKEDLIASYYEGITIRDSFEEQSKSLRIDLKSSDVGTDDVKDTLRDYDLVHYAGHADTEDGDADRSSWRLSDGGLTTSDVRRMAGGKPLPALVFANACRSGEITEIGIDQQAYGINGMATAFLLGGVRHFVGTLWDIPDESSCRFALAFYRDLLDGGGVGRAVQRARHCLASDYGEEAVLWTSYVLYGDPTVAYFQQKRQAELPQSAKQKAETTATVIPLHQPQRRRRVRGATAVMGMHVVPPSSALVWLSLLLPSAVVFAAMLYLLISFGRAPAHGELVPAQSGGGVSRHPAIFERYSGPLPDRSVSRPAGPGPILQGSPSVRHTK